MTTILSEGFGCDVCGNVSNHSVISSSNATGSMDLDTRPPKMIRSTMPHWIQRCPACGYCAEEISKPYQNNKEVVENEVYQNQLTNMDYPDLANTFLCWSMLTEKGREYNESGLACVHAAWACDDCKSRDAAKYCRRRAVHLLQKAQEAGQAFAELIGEGETILADLLRRSGDFELAKEMCDLGIAKSSDLLINTVLEYQKHLIEMLDTRCYLVSDAIEYMENP